VSNTSDKQKKKKKKKRPSRAATPDTSGRSVVEHERQIQLKRPGNKMSSRAATPNTSGSCRTRATNSLLKDQETKCRHERHMGEKDGAVDAVSTRKEASTYRMFQSCPNPYFNLVLPYSNFSTRFYPFRMGRSRIGSSNLYIRYGRSLGPIYCPVPRWNVRRVGRDAPTWCVEGAWTTEIVNSAEV
jgi:hypothetical protein